MREYDIISPANERELSQEIRRQPLTDRRLGLVALRALDEFSIRRGVTPKQEEIPFYIDALYVDRPTAVIGRVQDNNGNFSAARIDAVGKGDDDTEHTLRLVVSSED